MDSELTRINKLQGLENWLLWKFQVQVILKSAEAWELVNKDHKPPDPIPPEAPEADKKKFEEEMRKWNKKDVLAQKIIVTTMTEQPMTHILNLKTSPEMWDKLIAIYEQKSDATAHLLKKTWYKLEKDPAHDLATHIACIENLAHRLNAIGDKIDDKDIIMKILLTLPTSYDYFVTSWESTHADEKTRENLTSRLLIEEMRMNQRSADANALAANTSRGKEIRNFKSHNNSSKKDLDSKNNQGNKNAKKKTGKCHVCNKPGHWANECWHNPKNMKNKTEEKGEGLISQLFVSEQKSSDGKVDTWYFDTGASDHMSHRKEWFINYSDFDREVPIKIGDGEIIAAKGQGSINIFVFNGKEWTENHLQKVLYVPKLKYNLFSGVQALDKNLILFADKNHCKFTKQGKVIAVGERTGKLFVMKFKVNEKEKLNKKENVVEHQANIATKVSLSEWHQRLVHQNYAQVKKV